MKITLDIPEHEIKEAVENIPPDFFTRPGVSPIRTIAFALKEAWENRHVSTVKAVTTEKVDDPDEAEGFEVIRVNFGKKGPLVMVPEHAVQDLRGPDGITIRDIIMDSVKATLDRICTH